MFPFIPEVILVGRGMRAPVLAANLVLECFGSTVSLIDCFKCRAYEPLDFTKQSLVAVSVVSCNYIAILLLNHNIY